MKNKNLRVVIRVDASCVIGSGHVMRCLTLAQELQNRGCEIVFISREHPGNLIHHIEENSFDVIRLPAPPQGRIENITDADYLGWLNVSQEQDANDALRSLIDQTYDWLIVDHYSLDALWEEMMRSKVKKIMVIDDLANRKHNCDLLLDQNYCIDVEKRYQNLVPNVCTCLIGPNYALLQPEYAQLKRILPFSHGEVHRVLVFFGGSDLTDETSKVLIALSSAELAHLTVDIVIGGNYPNPKNIAIMIAERPGTILHQNLSSLAGLMARADLFIGAGGATTWERMCLGLPSLVVSVAENQQQFTDALILDKFQVSLPNGILATSTEWNNAIVQLTTQPGLVAQLSVNSSNLIDGLGVKRVAREILEQNALTIRSARKGDEALTFRWKNDEERKIPQHNSMSGSDYATWFYKTLSDSNCHIVIGEDKYGLGLGYVYFEINHPKAEVMISVHTSLLSNDKLPESLLIQALNYWRTKRPIKAFNMDSGEFEPSKQFFLKLNNVYERNLQDTGQSLRISIICDSDTWILKSIEQLELYWLNCGHSVCWVFTPSELVTGDVCFILSCSNILKPEQLALHTHNLVVHSSNLPEGRGWSPMTWQVIEGKNKICTTLFEASAELDSGVIYAQEWIELDGTELIDEWREKQAEVTKKLCSEWINIYPKSVMNSHHQVGENSYYSRRRSDASMLNPDKTLREQFNLLRVVDNEKYPAFFHLNDQQYQIFIKKVFKK